MRVTLGQNSRGHGHRPRQSFPSPGGPGARSSRALPGPELVHVMPTICTISDNLLESFTPCGYGSACLTSDPFGCPRMVLATMMVRSPRSNEETAAAHRSKDAGWKWVGMMPASGPGSAKEGPQLIFFTT
eukprot:430352-Hanusia_phi.AAC.1